MSKTSFCQEKSSKRLNISVNPSMRSFKICSFWTQKVKEDEKVETCNKHRSLKFIQHCRSERKRRLRRKRSADTRTLKLVFKKQHVTMSARFIRSSKLCRKLMDSIKTEITFSAGISLVKRTLLLLCKRSGPSH